MDTIAIVFVKNYLAKIPETAYNGIENTKNYCILWRIKL